MIDHNGDAESQRVAAEGGRVDAETHRVEAETDRVSEGNRRPYLLFAFLAVITLLLAAGNLIQLVVINPTAQENKSDIKEVTRENSEGVCAIVRQTADSYRTQTVTKQGTVEPINHYRRRLGDQLFTLRLVRNRHCPGVGDNFQKRIKLAILEIEELLLRTRPPPDAVSTQKQSKKSTAEHTTASGVEDTSSLAAGPAPPAAAGGGHRHDEAPSAGSSPAPAPTHQGHHHASEGGGGGHAGSHEAAPPAEGAAPAPEAPTAPPGESGPGGGDESSQPPPPAEESKPEAPGTSESKGLNVCIENPLLPLCVGVKGSSIAAE